MFNNSLAEDYIQLRCFRFNPFSDSGEKPEGLHCAFLRKVFLSPEQILEERFHFQAHTWNICLEDTSILDLCKHFDSKSIYLQFLASFQIWHLADGSTAHIAVLRYKPDLKRKGF